MFENSVSYVDVVMTILLVIMFIRQKNFAKWLNEVSEYITKEDKDE